MLRAGSDQQIGTHISCCRDLRDWMGATGRSDWQEHLQDETARLAASGGGRCFRTGGQRKNLQNFGGAHSKIQNVGNDINDYTVAPILHVPVPKVMRPSSRFCAGIQLLALPTLFRRPWCGGGGRFSLASHPIARVPLPCSNVLRKLSSNVLRSPTTGGFSMHGRRRNYAPRSITCRRI